MVQCQPRPMNLELFVLGTSGMMPLPGRSLTSVLLRREGDLFLFDCGEGTQLSLRKLNLKWKKITAVFISHTHADHVTGLPGILMLSSQVEREEPLYIIGPPRIQEYVEASRRILDMYINYDIEVIEITDEGIPFRREGFAVHAGKLSHSKPCYGYSLVEETRPGVFHPDRATGLGVPRGPLWSRLQHGESVSLEGGRVVTPDEVMGPARKGRKVSYVTDTLPVPRLPQFVAGSDVLICEGMFTQEFAESAREKKHLTALDAGRIARDGKVKSLGLIHYSPRYMNRDLKLLLDEAQTVFPETFLTKDLQAIEIPFED
jgi:ribonuclease Z